MVGNSAATTTPMIVYLSGRCIAVRLSSPLPPLGRGETNKLTSGFL